MPPTVLCFLWETEFRTGLFKFQVSKFLNWGWNFFHLFFYENNYPANISWWWQFRVDYFKPSGYVDTDIYNGGSFRDYTNAVYLNGAHFLDDLRERMGYGNFSKFLKEYAARYSHGRATSADFFALMRETVNVDISDLLDDYFYGSY